MSNESMKQGVPVFTPPQDEVPTLLRLLHLSLLPLQNLHFLVLRAISILMNPP